ncbi:MAG: dihydroorotase [Planctomycetota bacterium]
MKIRQHPAMLIAGGRVIDPESGRDEVADIAIIDGVIVERAPKNAYVIDASELIVCPGFMDLHVHLREPGQTHKETIETGTTAAAAGGFTFVACMPNTKPPIDNPHTVRLVLERACAAGACAVGPVAAITQGRAGEELTDFASLLGAGAVAFSDDGDGVNDDALMRAAFEQAREVDALLIQHCEYKSISAGGVMHLGEVSRRVGLPGLDPRSEETMIERDIDFCRQTGGRYHVAHVSTARGVELVRQAKAAGLPVTAEVCTHHLVLTDEACADGDPNTKMHPPLRPRSDVEACRRGLLDGTIDCIVTDHAPHTREEKAVGFLRAPPGIVGLETAVGVAAEALIESGLADWRQLVAWFTAGPAGALNRTSGSALARHDSRAIDAGHEADLTLLDPHCRWTVDPSLFESKSQNTPFAGRELVGQAIATIRGPQVRLAGSGASNRF